MFDKLAKRMCLPTVIIAAVLIVFIDVFAVVMLANTLKDAYNENGQSMAERAMSLCVLYINSVSSATYNLSTDEDVIYALTESGERSEVASKLNNACNYSLRIDAITLYTTECLYSDAATVYTSSEISGQPSLTELMTNEDIAAFVAGDDDFFFSFRKDNIAQVYHNVPYQQSLGIVTCCRKVYDEDGNTVGYIFADVQPSNLYSYILSGQDLEDAVTFLSYGDAYFEYEDNAEHEEFLSGDYGGYFKFEVTAEEFPVTLTIFTDNGEYVSAILIMTAILVAVSAILMVVVYFVSRRISRGLTDRLDALAAKMDAAADEAPEKGGRPS